MRSAALFTVSAVCISASAAEVVAVDAQQRASLLAFYAQQYPGEPAARLQGRLEGRLSHQAELLDISGSKAGLDDAIGNLVAWMDAVQDKLSEDDLALLCEIGGVLYREGPRRRMEGAVPD